MMAAALRSRELRIRRRSRMTGAREHGYLLAEGEKGVTDKAYIACR